MGYTKLWKKIIDSSIWDADDKTRIVWITMLAMSNQAGYVESTQRSLARNARVSMEDCEKALQVLSSPDPESSTKEDDGRRIQVMDGGWLLLNHQKYRKMRDDSERNAYMREYMKQYRKSLQSKS